MACCRHLPFQGLKKTTLFFWKIKLLQPYQTIEICLQMQWDIPPQLKSCEEIAYYYA